MPCAARASSRASSSGWSGASWRRRAGWAKERLLLSTDPTLSAPAIVEAYSKRWSIEPLFRDLKIVDGLGAMWQRGRTALLRWLHLVQIARTLLVLLTARAEPQTLALIRLGGWRPAATLTPGLVKEALAAASAISRLSAWCPQHAANPGRFVAPDHLSAPPQHERRSTAFSDRLQPMRTARSDRGP